MTRRTFFSFHYKNDVQRAWVVKNSQVVKNHEDTGFFDSSAFEKAKNEDSESLKRFLRKEMTGSSVVSALIGAETAERRWVRFEIMQAVWDARGLMGIRIHSIGDWQGYPSAVGQNPFDLLGVYTEDKKIRLIQRSSTDSKWAYTNDFGQAVIPKWPYTASSPPEGCTPLSRFFKVHNWSSNAHNEIEDWLEAAAKQAGR